MKILISDYDSTFYINEDDIKLNVKAVDQFMKKNGNYFVIATGRSYLDFIKKRDKYAIKNKLLEKIDFSLLVSYFCCSAIDSRVSFDSGDITKINLEYSSVSDARRVYDMLLGDDELFSFINIFLVCSDKALEIVSKNVDKVNAVSYLQDFLGVGDGDIYTIGDNYTDYLMIKYYSGYCMSNSVDKVKEIATKEYESVSDLIFDIEND